MIKSFRHVTSKPKHFHLNFHVIFFDINKNMHVLRYIIHDKLSLTAFQSAQKNKLNGQHHKGSYFIKLMHRRHQRDFPPIICGSFTELSERVNVCEKIANGLLIADTEAIIAHGAQGWAMDIVRCIVCTMFCNFLKHR